ncbi:DUF5343 domain-containing protein [Litorimonas sp. RW-G-Af-16]|uniref:DUF5343 domain-containing protein n=1 Tax=Litorimonas sp. RW-G-Af-16 TaxID=3241168 RepID=UPI00390C6BAE
MSHPYISGPKNIALMLAQLRKNFPSTVTSDTVKRLGLASNNESYVINSLTFVGLLDEDGKKTENAAQIFSISKDEAFQQSFSSLVKDAYNQLFDLHGDSAWDLSEDELLDFFRQADQTSETIGKRQVKTFKVFAGFSGKEELPDLTRKSTKTPKPKNASPTTRKDVRKVSPKAVEATTNTHTAASGKNEVAVTVRVEVNLPPNGDQKTYDAIFASIRKNLMDD